MADNANDLISYPSGLQPVVPDASNLEERVIVLGDTDGTVSVDPKTGVAKIENDDGSVTIDPNPILDDADDTPATFTENLAEKISADERQAIGSRLLEAIAADEQSRAEWLETRAKGIDLLGFKMEEPRGDTGGSTAPLEGMSTVRHPMLAEAVIRFQSNSSAELLPAGGPVKVRNDTIQPPLGIPQPPGMGHNGGPPMEGVPAAPPIQNPDIADDLAEALEKDMNHYLTVTDKGYRPDTDRMLFWVGFGGCGFKKVYNDPIRRMPMSRSVDAADLIVSNAANDIDDAGRVTHRILMRKSTLVRMQIAGVYRTTALTQPNEQLNPQEQKIAEIQGFTPQNRRPEDNQYTIYECYCDLDLPGYEHKENGRQTGLELPYRVTIEKDSREVLEIRRNWKQDDQNCLPKKVFVKYPFVPALGFYEIGLLHILGNTDRALTAAWRLILDAGMFASFPGFLYSDTASRQATNQFRIPPAGGMKIQTGSRPIGDVVMPLPYRDMTQGLQSHTQHMEVTAQRVGGTAEVMVGEGKQDAPVGTTLALIEQATKMLAAVHVRLHSAQAEEFQLLKERFREDPGAFWRHNRRPAQPWEVDTFLAALDNYDLVPAADPNTPSHMHRLMKATALAQLVAMAPQLYNLKAVNAYLLRTALGISNPDALLNDQPPAPPPEPGAEQKLMELQLKAQEQQQEHAARMAELQADIQAKQAEAQQKASETILESRDRQADRDSRETVAGMKLASERARLASQNGSGAPLITGGLGQQASGFPRPI